MVVEQLELMETDTLIPYARNSHSHSEEQVTQLAASIHEFGFCAPILIDGDNQIIAGHGRVMAAKKLKLETVPCRRLEHLSDAQKRAYVIADNRLAENATWDEELLANELSDLFADEFEVDLLGFNPSELEKQMGFHVDEIEPPHLASGDREPFRQMTFSLHDEQYETIQEAMEKAKSDGGGESELNPNSNGNLLACICEAFING